MQVGIPTRFLCHFGHHKSLEPAWNVIKGESLNVVGRVAAAELQWQQPDMASVSGSLFLSLSLSVSLLNTLSFSLSLVCMVWPIRLGALQASLLMLYCCSST
jgi:hypothetical protein